MPLSKAEINRLRELRHKKHREESGHFVVEGPKVIGELLAAGHAFAEVYATDGWSPPVPDAAEAAVQSITAEEMARISHYPTPSTVLAVGRITRAMLQPDELLDGYTLALDGIQDPGNVGTLLRIADWFGFARVLLAPDCADLFSQKVINASMGSFARMRVITTDLSVALRTAGVPVLGCDLRGTPLSDVTPPPAGVVVVGSEGRGLSPEVEATLTQRVTIPRLGQAESLNAGVAAGIVCAHLRAPATSA